MFQAIFQSPIGRLGLQSSNKGVTALQLLSADTSLIPPQTPLAELTIKQLENYFVDPKYIFNLPLDLKVTSYQKRVLDAVANIPVGETKTYGEIAKILKSGPRAVGNACGSNPIPFIIPCHRVVGAYGLGGYGGSRVKNRGEYLNIKRWLLQHELKAFAE